MLQCDCNNSAKRYRNQYGQEQFLWRVLRELANRRIWPAIDLQQSGTRKEEKLLSPEALAVSYKIRRTLLDKDPIRGMEGLTAALAKFPTNAEFIATFDERQCR